MMCDLFDVIWKPALALLLFFSIATLLLQLKYSTGLFASTRRQTAASPRWLALWLFWGRGVVGIAMLVLMVLGFVCAGSPGDIKGFVPN